MADFLINVRTEWPTGSVKAYAQEVTNAIARIKAAAAGGAPQQAVHQQLVGEQVRMEANLTTLRKSGAVPQADYAQMAQQQREAMAAQARAVGVELLDGRERQAAANRLLTVYKRAAATSTAAAEAQTNADQKRARDAARAAAAAGSAPPPPRAPGEATYDRAVADQAARQRAAADARSIPIIPDEAPGAFRQRARQADLDAAMRTRVERMRSIASREGEIAALAHEEAELRGRIKRDLQATESASRRAAAREDAIAAGAKPGGTLFQRAESRIRSRPGQEPIAPETLPTLGQSVGQGVLSAARFGAGAGLLYGAVNTIRDMVTQATALERTFNQIEAQFRAADQAAQFPQFKASIFAIARETGVAATDVAFVAFQMKGAFGDTTKAIEQTTAAIRIARVTGLELNEVVDSLTAASLSMKVPIEEVGDAALGIQERFGVLAKETIKAVADLAPVAAEAGLSVKELNALVGVAQATSGRSGAAIAEAFGRILPSIQGVSGEIVNLYSSLPQLSGGLDKVAKYAALGQSGQILLQLIRDYGKLDKTTQNYVISLLGGRREAQALIPVLQNSARLVNELDRSESDAGKTAEYFAKLQDTLAQKLSRLQAAFREMSQSLFQAGLGDALKDLVTVGGALLTILAGIVRAMELANRATGGLVAKVLELLIAFKAIRAIGGGLGGVLGRATGAAGRGVGAGPSSGLAYIAQDLASQGYAPAQRFVAEEAGATAARGGRLARAGSAVGRGASAVGAGLGINVLSATAVFESILIQKAYSQKKDSVDRAADAFAAKLAAATDEQLRSVAEEHLSIGDKVRQKVFGHKDPNKAAFDLLQQHRYKKEGIDTGSAAIKEGGLFEAAGIKPEDLQKLRDRAEKGDRSAIDRLEQILNALRANPATSAKLDTAVQAVTQAQGQQDAYQAAATGATLQQVAEIKAAFEAGATSYGAYVAGMRKALASYQLIRSKGPLPPELAKQEADLQREFNKVTDDRAKALVERNLAISELGGGGGAQERVTALTNLLKSGTLKTPEAQIDIAKELADAGKALLDEQIAMADSATEAAEIGRRGVKLPDSARIAELSNTLLNLDTTWSLFLQETFKNTKYAGDLTTAIANRAITGAITIAQASKAEAEARIADLRAKIKALQGAGQYGPFLEDSEIGRLQKFIDSLGTLPDIPAAPGTIRSGATDQKRLDKAAQKEREAKAKEAHKAAEDEARARLALRKAQAEGDPVAQADIAIEEARYSAQIAVTNAEKLNAQTAMVQALRQRAEASLTMADAYRSVDKALADAAGDAVKSAQIELDGIREHLASARARGDKVGAVNLEAQLIAQQRVVDKTTLDTAEKDIDFYHEMGQTTLGQTIASYEALLPLAAKNKDDYQALLLKINQLRKEGSQNFAFNIPSEIKLPTLYEVRRANQTAAAGQSYQDARIITINFTANNTADSHAIANEIVDRFSGPSRFGALPRGY